MENASKALIIAGSILLSILIIALGMFIFSNSSSTSDGMTSTLSENEKQTFNIKIEKYVGEQTGSSVASLISTLRANASTNQKSGDKIPAVGFQPQDGDAQTIAGGRELLATGVQSNDGITLQDYINTLSRITNLIQRSHTYYVAVQYNEAGLISRVGITYTATEAAATTLADSLTYGN